MTIRAKLGLVVGTRDNPSQPITVFDDAGAALDYKTAYEAAVAAAPSEIFSATPDPQSVQVEERKDSVVRFLIGYTRRGQNILTRSVNAQTKAKKLYHFLSAGSVYGTSGADITSDNTYEKWKVGGGLDATVYNSGQEITVDPLSPTRDFTYRGPRAAITDNYIDAVESMVTKGVFNDAGFLSRAAKTLQLLSFTANEREDGDWELSYGMAYQPVQINVDVGDGVQIPTLYANQTYWPIQKEVYADAKQQRKTVGVVVGDAWPTAAFTDLKLPWQGSLTTRTNATSGSVTTLYTHDIATGNTVYLFWNGGYMQATAGAVGSFTVDFSGGTGDALPFQATNLCITKYTLT